MFCPSQIKYYIITGLVSNFFYAPCNRVITSLQKRNHHKCFHSRMSATLYILIVKHLCWGLFSRLRSNQKQYLGGCYIMMVANKFYKAIIIVVVFSFNVYNNWSRRGLVGSDEKPGFEPQARHENKIWKAFLRRFPLSRFLPKTLRVNKSCHVGVDFKL